MDQQNPHSPRDISTYAPRHRSNEGNRKRSGDFTLSENRVIPWPATQLPKVADSINNVQIAIEDRAYADELGRLLEEDGKHQVCVVDQPNPTIDGVVVLDETTLARVGVLKGAEALRYIVVRRKEAPDYDKLLEAGVQRILPADYPTRIALAVILGLELTLNPSGP